VAADGVKKVRTGRAKRPGVSELVATLLLIALAVVAAVIFFAFASGLFSNLTKGGPSTLVTVQGQMVVPGSVGGTGVVTLVLYNGGTQPINAVAVSCNSSPFVPGGCAGFGPAFTTPIPVGHSATASVTVTSFGSSFVAGSTYVMLVTATFDGGSQQIVLVNLRSTA